MSVGIDADPIEQIQVARRTVQLTREYWLEVDGLLRAVFEMDSL